VTINANLLDRRELLKGGAVLLLAAATSIPARAQSGGPVYLNAWVSVGPGDQFTLALAHAEMGQGITTTLPAILADELDVEFGCVRLVNADFDPAYRHPVYQWQFTGNSESIGTYAELVRAAGAAARFMLLQAAADHTKVSAEKLSTANGMVFGAAKPLSYAELAPAAARIRPPEKLIFKPAAMRKSLVHPRVDIPTKVDGSAQFGIDVVVPDMLSATVAFAPTAGGTLVALDEAAILAAPGVKRIVRLERGYAVVADRWWNARQAVSLGKPEWHVGTAKSTDQLLDGYRDVLRDGPFRTVKDVGTPPESTGRSLTYDFVSPYQAHATMEPMNCTVHLTANRCEIWAPTQGMEMTHLVAKQVTGLPDDAIVIHRTYLGGGFGRRLLGDFIKDAIIVARETGAPVKLLWTREADFAGDFYRPAMLHRVNAVLGPDGLPSSIEHRVVSPSLLLYAWPRGMFPSLADATKPADPPADYDAMPVEGLIEPLYALPHFKVDLHRYKSEVPVSVWRTTGHGPNNWGLESLIDECARAAKIDPLAYRRKLLAGNRAAIALLDALERYADLDKPAAAGEHRAIAIAEGFGSRIAQAVSLSVDADRRVRLRRVVSIVDLGQTLDEVIATRNIEGGVIWGLSALRTEAEFVNGGLAQTNFDSFDPLHLWETPVIETHFVNSGGKPGGVGEIGPVPTLAAVCNAIAAATGVRITRLPFSHQGFSIA
jgi:isoquinoline 1-oxidoreductase beta subunit